MKGARICISPVYAPLQFHSLILTRIQNQLQNVIQNKRFQKGKFSLWKKSDSDESRDNEPLLPDYALLGHLLPCSVAQCDSKLFNTMAVSVHYPLLHKFPSHVCRCKENIVSFSTSTMHLVQEISSILWSRCGMTGSYYGNLLCHHHG